MAFIRYSSAPERFLFVMASIPATKRALGSPGFLAIAARAFSPESFSSCFFCSPDDFSEAS